MQFWNSFTYFVLALEGVGVIACCLLIKSQLPVINKIAVGRNNVYISLYLICMLIALSLVW